MNEPFVTDRIPPQALDVERTVLGSILTEPDVAEQAQELLSDDCFYAQQNRIVWACLYQMMKDGTPIDAITLADELRKREQLETIGAEPYISELVSNVATTINIEHHCKILLEKAILREAITQSGSLMNRAFSNESAKTIVSSISLVSDRLEVKLDKASSGESNKARVISIRELKQEVERFYEVGEDDSVITLELENLAKLFKPAIGDFTVMTGHPSHGKTELMQTIMIDLSLNHGWKWLGFTPESYPYKYFVQNTAEKFCKKSFFSTTNRMTKEDLEAAINFLDSSIHLIDVGDDRISTDQMIKIVRDYTAKNDIQGIMIDPFNSLDVLGEKNENRTYSIGRFLDRMRILGRRRNFSSYILAHPKDTQPDFKTKKHSVPRLSDIDGSRNWWNMAYNGISVFRYFKLDVIAVHVLKIKFKTHGKVGVCYLKYDPYTGVFSPHYPEKNPALIEKDMAEQQGMAF